MTYYYYMKETFYSLCSSRINLEINMALKRKNNDEWVEFTFEEARMFDRFLGIPQHFIK